MPKVSIITVTRLRPQLLSQAIESLNAQSSQDFEWIIVNDGEDIATRELISNSQIDFTHTYLEMLHPDTGFGPEGVTSTPLTFSQTGFYTIK